jgi:N-acetyl-alpha-D-muramate 1-phosphate uridylyltransferase
VEVAGEPFLAHQLRMLRRHGVSRAVLCLGYRGEQVRDYAGSGGRFGLALDYSFDGPVLLGTAGAIRRALPLLPGHFLVLYGDSYLPCDYAAVERAFLDSGKSSLMTVYPNRGRWDTSNVEFDGARILAYDKANRTPRMSHIDYGLGCFRRDVFEPLPLDRPSDLAAVYQDLLRRGDLAAWEAEQRFYEVGSFDGIRELEEYLTR